MVRGHARGHIQHGGLFRNTYLDEWITKPLSVAMIADVDKSEVVSASLIQSPVLGPISPLQLSGGVKTLMLMDNDLEHVFNASTCGDNCAKWILEIARRHGEEGRDLTINLRHLMNFGRGEFELRILNDDVVVRSMREITEIAGFYV